jgi:hypothetical protein
MLSSSILEYYSLYNRKSSSSSSSKLYIPLLQSPPPMIPENSSTYFGFRLARIGPFEMDLQFLGRNAFGDVLRQRLVKIVLLSALLAMLLLLGECTGLR